MTTSLQATLQLLGKESVDENESPAQGAGAMPRTYNAYNLIAEMTDIDLAPVDLSGSVGGTIDLTAAPLAREVSIDQDLTGANLFALLVAADEDNLEAVTVGPGTSNGYPVPTVALRPGGRFVVHNLHWQSVDATHKTIGITGALSSDKVHIIAYFMSYGTGS